MNKKNILLISPMILPIPATKGGAIETLITNILDVNDIEQDAYFIVLSNYDMTAFHNKYLYSKILYFNNKNLIGFLGYILKLKWYLQRLYRKVKQIFNKKIKSMDFFSYQIFYIAKKYNIDYVICEGINENYVTELYKIIDSKNIYTHIHFSRDEDINVRNIVPNSLSISKYVRSKWIKSNTKLGKNYVLYNGIDLCKFEKNFSNEKKEKLRRKLGVYDNDILVIYCGRIIKEKGVEELLESFNLLKEDHFKLLLIGTVNFDTSDTTEYSKRIHNKSIQMNNVVALGYVPNNELYKYYLISDIQVIPSIWQEGAGLVSIEGMAAGLPIICTKSGGLVEYVDDDVSIQIPIDNNLVKNLANEIKKLGDNKILCEKMSDKALQRSKLFSKENYYHNFLSILEKNN